MDGSPTDPRFVYVPPGEETLQYAAPDARIEPLPLQVARLRKENQDIRARLDMVEDRLRSVIQAQNTLYSGMIAAKPRN